MKRKRNDELEAEYGRQVACLNRTFRQWVHNNDQANPCANWEEGMLDYVSHAQLLKEKFCTQGTAYVFGTGDCGQLGLGQDEDDSMDKTFLKRPAPIPKIQDMDLCCVSAGGMHNLAIDAADGSVVSWGCSDNETLGRKTTGDEENFPGIVRSLQNKIFAVQVSAGDAHSAVLGMNGEVYIWGCYLDKDGRKWFRRDSGESSFQTTQLEPLEVPEVSGADRHGGATQIASGANHTMVLCGDGTVFAWGLGEAGQLGRPVAPLKDEKHIYQKEKVYQDHLVPAKMLYSENSPVNNARYVGAGSHHSFILQAVRSRVFACGLNQYGQLALSDENKEVSMLTRVEALDNKGICAIHGGEHHSMAIGRDGSVYTFGRADSCELGVPLDANHLDGAGSFSSKPCKVKFDPPARVVSGCCGSHMCAVVTDDHRLYTWGFGDMAQLGNGSAKDQPTPKLVIKSKADPSPFKVSSITAGGQHSLCLSLS
ncbi:Regulator of chromosome condensation [Hondaea fermentalgiana]|uniref:Regulator of chromosome condensation n=1 Tax=Hondaea fermentalgiana TaxID=2315210 RepID=A0A2R5G424_9STRA|nr:Regulator of chromosome condensation [Hondaea fermentalgiana]|eukprot:GBG25782.1 Regulator of chromosome condensation [Hondaea fermentalgiana]